MNGPTVPLFPLPGLVLFPRTVMPLHVFEPRYYRLVTDALNGNRRLATANLRKGWDRDYFGSPPVYRTITIARILHEDRLPGKRYDILIEGIERGEILEELSEKPYRRVKYQSITEDLPLAERDAVGEATRELLSMASRISGKLPELKGCLRNLEHTHRHPGIIADQVASLLVREPYDRQSLLEESSVRRRVELVNVQLRGLLTAVAGSAD